MREIDSFIDMLYFCHVRGTIKDEQGILYGIEPRNNSVQDVRMFCYENLNLHKLHCDLVMA